MREDAMQLPQSICAFFGHRWGMWTPTPDARLLEFMTCLRCSASRERRLGLR
jgi:hypothetical protein